MDSWSSNNSNDVELELALRDKPLDWDFDVFELDEHRGPLRLLFPELLHRHKLLDQDDELPASPTMPPLPPIRREKLNALLIALDATYGANPYHNVYHAADVLLGVHNFLMPVPQSTAANHGLSRAL